MRSAQSLAARLFVILLLATVGIQVLSFGGVMLFFGNEGRRNMAEFLAADVAFVQASMRLQSPAQRQVMAEQLNSRGYYLFNLQVSTRAFEPFAYEPLKESAQAVQARVLTTDKVTQILWRSESGTGRPALEVPIDGEQKLVVIFLHRAPPFSRPSWDVILFYLVVVSIAVMAAAWWAVQLATQPIIRLSEAAQSLGKNLDAPPLEEVGPSELRSAAAAFNSMQAALQSHMRERTQILSSISHDLKTPLTRLRLRVGALLPDGNGRDRIEQDIDAMNLLIQEGLDYAQSSQLREPIVPVDIGVLLDNLAECYVHMGFDVQVRGAIDNAVRCAPRALGRALQNLVDNAVKYGQRARISVDPSEQHMSIRIEDDGPGLSSELLDKVFEPFFRAEYSRNRETGGTGLGLAIARNLLRAQGAEVSLTNGESRGLIATVVFAGKG